MKQFIPYLTSLFLWASITGCGTTSEFRYPNNDWNITMLDGSTVVAERADRVVDRELVTVSLAGRRSVPVDSIAHIGRSRRSYGTEGAIIGGLGGAVIGGVVGVQSVEPDPPKTGTGYFGTISFWTPSTAERETWAGILGGMLGGAVGAGAGVLVGRSVARTEHVDVQSIHPEARLLVVRRFVGLNP